MSENTYETQLEMNLPDWSKRLNRSENTRRHLFMKSVKRSSIVTRKYLQSREIMRGKTQFTVLPK